jgi:hypothetical protein
MPTEARSLGTTEESIESNSLRTMLLVQNLDTTSTDYVWISDQPGNVAGDGIRIPALGGSITLRRINGEEPEKTWYIVATTAATPVRIMQLFGLSEVVTVHEGNDNPQNPNTTPKGFDAPVMRRIR